MFLILLTLAILSALLGIYVRWLNVKRYWAKRGIPYIPPKPFLGHMDEGDIRQLQISLRRDLAFWRPALVVNCPDIGRRVLITDFSIFRDRFVTSGSYDPIGKHNMFTAKDPLWSSLRRRLNIVFTGSRLRNMYGLIQMKTKELLQRIDIEMSKHKCMNLRTVFCDYNTDLVGTASFGVAGDATLTGQSVLRTVTEDFMKFNLIRGIGWIIMFFKPDWVEFARISLFPKKSTDCFIRVYRAVVAQRGGYGTKVTEIRDMIDALIKMKQDCLEENADMPEEILIAQAVAFLQAGFDSSTNILSWSIYELAFQPEIQENLYQEILNVQKKNGGADIEVGSLADSKYLNSVLEEALRKYPPMGWIDRVASQDYKIDETLTVPAGMPVYVNAFGIHYDPEIYPEPTRFKPERFLNADNDNKQSQPRWSFGDGPRNCIGRRFAMISLRYALACIVLNYKCRPTLTSPDPTKVQIGKRSMFYSAGEPLLVEFVKRSQM